MSDDIFIHHEGLTTSTEDLNQAQKRMADNLLDFQDQIRPHLNNSDGALKEAWNQVNSTVASTIDRANLAMQSAVQTLTEIHNAHKQADAKGAAGMGA